VRIFNYAFGGDCSGSLKFWDRLFESLWDVCGYPWFLWFALHWEHRLWCQPNPSLVTRSATNNDNSEAHLQIHLGELYIYIYIARPNVPINIYVYVSMCTLYIHIHMYTHTHTHTQTHARRARNTQERRKQNKKF
jgi:hypothetical protein